jgi:hypothetical protein
MISKFALMASLSAFTLTGCIGIDPVLWNIEDKTRDTGIDSGDLSEMVAGIWVDPHGCDHWIIDDGVEGYLSARLADNGKPVCSGTGVPNTATGPFIKGRESKRD